jgi:cytochrome c-type protein NapB
MIPYRRLLVAAGVLAAFVGLYHAQKAVEAETLGLSKTSVLDTPAPAVPASKAKEPGENLVLGAYFSKAPPLVPHLIRDFLPIRIGENACADCHDAQDQIGEALGEGEPTPIPASHYTDLRRAPEKVGKKLVGARYVCTQCHAPQTDAVLLVANTYGR